MRPRPLERRKTPLSESSCFFQIIIYKQSESEKISVTIIIDLICVRIIKHKANQVKKYNKALNKINFGRNKMEKGFPKSKFSKIALEKTFQNFSNLLLQKSSDGGGGGGVAIAPASQWLGSAWGLCI